MLDGWIMVCHVVVIGTGDGPAGNWKRELPAMRDLPNIEKSAFHKGQYVGYANGPWIIRRTNSSYGNWVATTCNPSDPAIYAFRLSDMSAKLTAITLR
jgi:hypothetical protein